MSYKYTTVECFRVKKLLDIILAELSGYLDDEKEALSIISTSFEMLDLWELNNELFSPVCGEIAAKELELFEYTNSEIQND